MQIDFQIKSKPNKVITTYDLEDVKFALEAAISKDKLDFLVNWPDEWIPVIKLGSHSNVNAFKIISITNRQINDPPYLKIIDIKEVANDN